MFTGKGQMKVSETKLGAMSSIEFGKRLDSIGMNVFARGFGVGFSVGAAVASLLWVIFI
jgi:hypothetical protein